MTPSDVSFIRRCMKRYYFERFDNIEIPSHMPMREFGYRRAGSGMTRHLQLHDAADLRVLLLQAAPLEVYVSNARYLFPDRSMPEKAWEDAHIIFDIDAKDLNLECRPSHTVSMCERCGHNTTGPCERCGHRSIRKASVACTSCMKAAKGQVRRLLNILSDDLGIREGARVYFSGNEGFHVHIHDEPLAQLGTAERAELADYVAFQGILPERLGIYKGKAPSLPRKTEGGWRGRFAQKMRSSATKRLSSEGYDAFVRSLADMDLGVRIDPGVTMDIHRIFRMPGTVNGKSGMAKVACGDLDAFNPYAEAVVITGEPVYVRASCPVQFRMMKSRFGPYVNEYVQVPSYAAAYMICKGLAHAV